jgi:hypothetical protein
MNLLFPGFLIAAGVAAAAVVALHFLVTRQPSTDIFPTVRFLPQAKVRSTALAIKLTDILLLLLRVAAILLLGIALAQPRFAVTTQAVAEIVMVDVSRGVARDAAWKQVVLERAAEAEAVIVFDDAAREVAASELEQILDQPPAARGSLSSALIVAMRAASRLR